MTSRWPSCQRSLDRSAVSSCSATSDQGIPMAAVVLHLVPLKGVLISTHFLEPAASGIWWYTWQMSACLGYCHDESLLDACFVDVMGLGGSLTWLASVPSGVTSRRMGSRLQGRRRRPVAGQGRPFSPAHRTRPEAHSELNLGYLETSLASFKGARPGGMLTASTVPVMPLYFGRFGLKTS